MKLSRDWLAVSGVAVSKCSEAHIMYLVEDARHDIVALSLAKREAIELLEAMLGLHIAHHNQPIHAKAREVIAKHYEKGEA